MVNAQPILFHGTHKMMLLEMLLGEAGLSFLYICLVTPISEVVKRKKEGRAVPLCPPGLGTKHTHIHMDAHPGERTRHGERAMTFSSLLFPL